MPDFTYEQRFAGPVAGVDEVGRGPLAGPVVAAAVILPPNPPAGLLAMIDDSKALNAKNRALAMAGLVAAGAEIALAAASVAEIERLNILQASLLAMRRAIARLPRPPSHVLVDGNKTPGGAIPCTAIIGGDQKCFSIAAASIAAKILRDALMARLARRYPGYGWERNAGYAAAAHRAAIIALGPTPHHRTGFGPLLSRQPSVASVEALMTDD
jgi:ribonuclease HII